jgi:hypothetical protein
MSGSGGQEGKPKDGDRNDLAEGGGEQLHVSMLRVALGARQRIRVNSQPDV